MSKRTTVRQLCAEQGLDEKALAERTGLEARRIRAILEGRWTPSPAERTRIAAALGAAPEDIAWDHAVSVEHLQGHGPQFGRSP